VISLKAQGFFYSFSDLSPSDFLGTWLDVYRSQDFPYAKGNCTQGFYYITEDGKIAAKNSEIVNGVNSSATAEVFIDPDTSGQLYVKFSHFGPAGDFKIIHTDYKNSALVFSCTSVLLAHMKFAWILVRRLDVEPPGLYYQLIERFGISLDRMINTNHVNC
jgi:apolipoprotein D and lipocalin family protein